MENQNIRKLLARYNSLFKEMDEVYHLLARHYGLSDSALWVLYTLREAQDIYTQSKICSQLSLSKQTVNSTLKNLERAGYIQLKPLSDNHRNKQIILTVAGETFAKQTVDNVFQIEQAAFAEFTSEESAIFLNLKEKYVLQLQKEANKILTSEKQ